MNKRIVGYFLISVLVFSYFFIVFDVKFRGPDEPIYFAYTASVIEDGDLNAVNQFYKGNAKLVSQTYNLPDFHNHGGTVLWAPIYAYGRLFGGERSIKCALSFSTVIFGFFTLLLTFALCRKFFSEKLSLWSTLLMFLATPYFYFTFFEPGNGQIIASLLSVISIFTLYYASVMKRLHWFLYGMFFSVCLAVKLDLWFQASLIAMCFMVLSIRKEISPRNALYFILGFLPVFILNLVNDYIKYGVMHKGEFYLFNLHNFYLFDQLFSSYRGYFYTSPIFYISLFGFTLVAIALFKKRFSDSLKRWKLSLLFLLAMYLFIKIFIISFRYAWGGGTTGARHLLTEFPVFVLLYAFAIENQKRFVRYIICVLSLILALWNLLVISEFMMGVDIRYLVEAPALITRLTSFGALFDILTHPKDIWLKLTVCVPLLAAVFLLIITVVAASAKVTAQERIFKLMGCFAVYAFLAYGMITLLNIGNNKRNVGILKAEGFFAGSVVLCSRDYEKEENVVSMEEMVRYFGLKKNYGIVEKIKQVRKKIYGD